MTNCFTKIKSLTCAVDCTFRYNGITLIITFTKLIIYKTDIPVYYFQYFRGLYFDYTN